MRGRRTPYSLRSFCKAAGTRVSRCAPNTASSRARSSESHSPAWYDSPKPISPLAPLLRWKAAGRCNVISGSPVPPAPSTVPSGRRTRIGNARSAQSTSLAATAPRRRALGSVNTPGQRSTVARSALEVGALVSVAMRRDLLPRRSRAVLPRSSDTFGTHDPPDGSVRQTALWGFAAGSAPAEDGQGTRSPFVATRYFGLPLYYIGWCVIRHSIRN